MRKGRLASLFLLCSVVTVAQAQVPNDPGEPGVITGKVLEAAGKSVPGAKVYAREHNMPQNGAVRYVTTDESGQFRIGNLRPGDYDVYAVPGHSTSMITRCTKRVHIPKDRPVEKVTLQIGSAINHKS